jgi:hypothetical protein
VGCRLVEKGKGAVVVAAFARFPGPLMQELGLLRHLLATHGCPVHLAGEPFEVLSGQLLSG